MKKEKLKKEITSLLAWALLMSIVMSGGLWTVLLFIMVACTVFWGFPQGEFMWFAVLTLPLVIWFWMTMMDDHSIENFRKKVFPMDYEGLKSYFVIYRVVCVIYRITCAPIVFSKDNCHTLAPTRHITCAIDSR